MAYRLRTAALLIVLGCLLTSPGFADTPTHPFSLQQTVERLSRAHPGKSGAFILEKGETALLARAWLADHAVERIDVQYFIWSSDNIGTLAAEALLRAAKRGVQVRVIIDDLLIDADDDALVALARHPNIEIRIYNPKHSVGTSTLERAGNVTLGFRKANLRMHDKTFIVDNTIAITGGRNMANEYFDYNQRYNFRDRDALLLGPVTRAMSRNFEQFWHSPWVVPVEKLLKRRAKKLPADEIESIYRWLHHYAANPENFAPEVRAALTNLPSQFSQLIDAMIWDEITFISDDPGKNDGRNGLKGGGKTTLALIDEISRARRSITIQSPYLIVPDGGIELFASLIKKGVKIRISTNSLASTDNLLAFSGYAKQRKKLLKAGIEIFEYRPNPAIHRELIERHQQLEKSAPTFAIHAKSMVIDGQTLFLGTFNLDPRSANLNTEVGILVRNAALASQVEAAIERDMAAENSWNAATKQGDPQTSILKKTKLMLLKLLPLKPVL